MIKNKLMIMLCAAGIIFSMGAKVIASDTTQRIWGSDRYATAIEISKSGWTDGSKYAILASGENFPDALAGSALAAKNSTCVLLLSDYIGEATKKFSYDKLSSVKNTEIIGGTSVVPDSLINKVVYPDDNEVLSLPLSVSKVRQGEWVYYSDAIDGKSNITLSKCKTDGTSKIKLSDKYASNITVVGDWIYFVGYDPKDTSATGPYYISNHLYKVKVDGTNESKLGDEHCTWFKIVDNKIYSSTGTSFITMDMDGGNKINVPVNGLITSADIIDNYFYYIEGPLGGKSKIYKMKIDGTDKVQMASEESDKIGELKIYNSMMYYTSCSDDNIYHLKKMKLDGTEKTSLVDINGDCMPSSFEICNDWIYYIGSYRSNLCKIKIDGSYNTKLLGVSAAGVKVANGWIYYNEIVDYDEFITSPGKVRIDGTDRRE